MGGGARESTGSPSETPEATPDESEGEDLLELVLAAHERAAAPARIEGVVVGRLLSVGAGGELRVDFPGCPTEDGAAARAFCAVTPADVGREVALLCEGGDPARPVLMGLMHQVAMADGAAAVDAVEAGQAGQAGDAGAPAAPAPVEATRDGERLVFEADKEIVLRCGKAQITLTRAGKIIIKGAYLLARSTGVNRIQGGSVQIN